MPSSRAKRDSVAAIALLDEPTRRGLYELVAARDRPIGRDEAAAAFGIHRDLAAFHLDRLARAGLLETEFRRLTGRTGPGAGRPAKLYRRAAASLAISLPARDYGRAADTFATAIERLDGETGRRAVRAEARARGRATGLALRHDAGPRADRGRLRAQLVDGLAEAGYEPIIDPVPGGSPADPGAASRIRLRNCPYRDLIPEHRDLTCGMNEAWASGLLEGLGPAELVAELTAEPGACCVTFREPTEP